MGLQPWRAKLIAQRLQQGAVIAYPTEGVWGLGCLPGIPDAVARILELKRRSWEEGLILVASDISQFDDYLAALSEDERATLEAAWPGPVTFLVPDRKEVSPEWIRGRHETVALRVSTHPVVCAICDELGAPMVSTSANPTGKAPAHNELRLRQYFPEGIDYIVPGRLGGSGTPTEIRDLASGNVLRSA